MCLLVSVSLSMSSFSVSLCLSVFLPLPLSFCPCHSASVYVLSVSLSFCLCHSVPVILPSVPLILYLCLCLRPFADVILSLSPSLSLLFYTLAFCRYVLLSFRRFVVLTARCFLPVCFNTSFSPLAWTTTQMGAMRRHSGTCGCCWLLLCLPLTFPRSTQFICWAAGQWGKEAPPGSLWKQFPVYEFRPRVARGTLKLALVFVGMVRGMSECF